jgi:hypothetical protein
MPLEHAWRAAARAPEAQKGILVDVLLFLPPGRRSIPMGMAKPFRVGSRGFADQTHARIKTCLSAEFVAQHNERHQGKDAWSIEHPHLSRTCLWKPHQAGRPTDPN